MSDIQELIKRRDAQDVSGYDGVYAVTKDGRIWSYKTNKFLKPIKNKKGYLRVGLYNKKHQKYYFIHRIVAETFIPNPNNFQQINHKDENKQNNNVENLEWCTPKYNSNYGTRGKRITEKQKGRIPKNRKKIFCIETNTVYSSMAEAQTETGINYTHISECCSNKRKTAGKFHWKYM